MIHTGLLAGVTHVEALGMSKLISQQVQLILQLHTIHTEEKITQLLHC